MKYIDLGLSNAFTQEGLIENSEVPSTTGGGYCTLQDDERLPPDLDSPARQPISTL